MPANFRSETGTLGNWSQERLHELLDYNPFTGGFYWRAARGGMAAGSVAGFMRPDGYVQVKVDGRLVLAHVLAWLWMMGKYPEADLDHRNRNRADNRWANLRLATRPENIANGGARKDNKLGMRGVSRHNGKYRARIMADGKSVFLGHFETIEAAQSAYATAQRRLYGEFANAG